MNPQVLQGILTPEIANLYGLGLKASITKRSRDKIITGIIITVTMTREGSPNLVFTGVVPDLWIVPNGWDQRSRLTAMLYGRRSET